LEEQYAAGAAARAYRGIDYTLDAVFAVAAGALCHCLVICGTSGFAVPTLQRSDYLRRRSAANAEVGGASVASGASARL